jgi:hypothetical protein
MVDFAVSVFQGFRPSRTQPLKSHKRIQRNGSSTGKQERQ